MIRLLAMLIVIVLGLVIVNAVDNILGSDYGKNSTVRVANFAIIIMTGYFLRVVQDRYGANTSSGG